MTGVVSLLLQARGVVSNILTLVLVFSTLVSAQTGQTVAGVGVAAGQNTMLQAGGEPVKPTTTTGSLPGNTGANNTSKTKPAANPPHTTQLPAGINRTTVLEQIVKSVTTTDKRSYFPGEAVNIKVTTDYNQAKTYLIDQLKQMYGENYDLTVRVNIQLPAGFAISQETLTRGPFLKNCTGGFDLSCSLKDYQFSYNRMSHSVAASFKVYPGFVNDAGFFDSISIKGTATNVVNVDHRVATTVSGDIQFRADKTGVSPNPFGHYDTFTGIPSEATFRVISRKTVLKASFQPVGLTEGQVVVRGDVVCTFPGGQPSRKTLMFTLKHNELANGRWDRVLHDMVDVGSNCTVTLNKGMVSAGWRWKTNTPIVVTESNITSQRTAQIRLEVERIPVDVAVTAAGGGVSVNGGGSVAVSFVVAASGNEASNVPVTIQLPKDGFVKTNATDNSTCTTTGRAMCPARWVYNANSHTVTATIPRIPAGGSVTVTVTGEAGLFEANSRDFTASAMSAFADANQGNNRASQKVTVKNKRVAVSLVLQPVGDYPTSGVV
ncbi:hypothetical protein KJY78_04330, partial [Canibacter sp. lx-45]|nr:hypothetical protein [Canibacter zhuwentaonis]